MVGTNHEKSKKPTADGRVKKEYKEYEEFKERSQNPGARRRGGGSTLGKVRSLVRVISRAANLRITQF